MSGLFPCYGKFNLGVLKQEQNSFLSDKKEVKMQVDQGYMVVLQYP